MKVKIKKLHPDAVIPAYAKSGDAGMDLTAISRKVDEFGNICYGTGLAFEIPEGYVGLIFPRSSNCKKGIILTNCVGVVDSGYRGEVSFKFRPIVFKADVAHSAKQFELMGIPAGSDDWYELHPSDIDTTYSIGDRVGQIIIMPFPQIEFEEVEELSETERGTQGYGSSGS